MKKFLAMLLIAAFALSFASCAKSNTTDAFIGTWENEKQSYTLIINKDKTGSLTENGGENETIEFTWIFDDATRTLILQNEEEGDTRLTYLEVNDTLVSAYISFERAE